MAQISTSPQQGTLTFNFCTGNSVASNLVAKKYSPKDDSGNVIDLTGYTNATLTIIDSTNTLLSSNVSKPMTVVAADATGITLSMTQAQVEALITDASVNARTSNGKFQIMVDNGTNYVLAGVGVYQIIPTA